MDTTLNRPAVDVGPPQARPGLALILGLLSIPGSTVAWSLPAGGSVDRPAARHRGNRARRARAPSSGVGVGMATAAIVFAGLAIAQMVVWMAVSALS